MSILHQLRKDFSLSAFVAGLIIVLVGFTSSAVLVYQAAITFGLGPEQASSWLGSHSVGIGILAIVLSIRFRAPILMAWSTAAAAILVAGTNGITVNEATGAFLFSAVLIYLSGVTGIFARLMSRIPIALASALLAGVLIRFCLDTFVSLKSQPILVGAMLIAYLFGRKWSPRLTMLYVLSAGIIAASLLGLLHFENVKVQATQFHFVMPHFSFQALLSLGLPIFAVTMASQNLTGLTVMRANGFTPNVSALMSWSGFTNILTSFFGGFTINLAAITAAIGNGPEAHEDPKRRYISGVVSGLLYLVIGLVAGTVTSIFGAFPSEMILAVAGFALMSTTASCLQTALVVESHREAAFITFLVAASGLTVFGIGPALWALIIGTLAQAFFSWRRRAT
jgi:benzoate membrane transport protein